MSAISEDNEVQYSDEEGDEDYEYDYSDDDVEEQSSDEEMDYALAGSTSGNGESTRSSKDRKKNIYDNPNAAPMRGGIDGYSGSVMDIDFGAVGGGFGNNNPEKVRMLDSSELLPVMKRRLREVTEVLSIPESVAAVLMREHRWAKERLFEAFYSDQDRILEKCGVKARVARCFSRQSTSSSNFDLAGKSNKKQAVQMRECSICCEDDLHPSQMLAMPCNHEFCRDCWNGFLDCAISGGPSCVRSLCPAEKCTEAVTEEEVAAAAPELKSKFERYQLRSFVEMNDMCRWCPGPGCTQVAMSGSAGLGGIADCDCGTRFCLRCGEEPHAPASCGELTLWKEKCKNESETANWILANTKPCPKCSSRIEKNQGCNHMSCQQCKYEFCWICLAPWADHGANTGGYYKCNRYDPNSTGDDNSDAARAKRELDRYLHYYKRFHAHSVAQKFAEKQLRETEARMILLQESTDNATWTDVEFLKAATEQLVECRRVLKYTYTFAYYLTDSTKTMQKERFEHHQEMLEKFTENLSELSEMPLAEMDRTDVVNQTRVVGRFMKNVLTYVEDGMEED
eukprot:CAMPEP_0195523328 /NCGR_PEP_ID=MMETSP0794_2-20130614/22352_1 /TAXON_ID=515487 /ORGANISM="Stephanopyxis turris, Strain CCMP 815" /LENGTH=566 /DNA_ID=CAMNT_0040653301 /DNA_START=138 /DNA_END=1838 /DNA_ORIENTATION=+